MVQVSGDIKLNVQNIDTFWHESLLAHWHIHNCAVRSGLGCKLLTDTCYKLEMQLSMLLGALDTQATTPVSNIIGHW